MLVGKYYDPWDLCVGLVSEYLDNAAGDGIISSELSKVTSVDTYDFSGDPTKPGVTAVRILVKPDDKSGENRGFRDTSHAIGKGARFWEYHIIVECHCFFIKLTRDKAKGREIASRVSAAVLECLADLPPLLHNIKTADGKWSVQMSADPYLQGGGIRFRDGGPKRPIKSQQEIVVGFVLRKY